MNVYELNSKQVSLITTLLLQNTDFECEDQEHQTRVRKESRELFNVFLTKHNEQEVEPLKTYISYE